MSKKQIIQLAVLTFFLYLGVFFLKSSEYAVYYDIYVLLTLVILSGIYVIYSQKRDKLVEYFRIFLYMLLGFLVYIFLDHNVFFNSYHLYREVIGFKPVDALYMIFTGFDFLYILLITAVLIFNKPEKYLNFKIGKININL